MQAIADLRDWETRSRVTVIINCSTKWVSSLALASAIRHASYSVLVVNCGSQDGSPAHFEELARRTGWTFAWLEWPLHQHGHTLDRLFQEIGADRVMLLDSDAEILDFEPAAAMATALDRNEAAYGSGFLQRECWLGTQHGVRNLAGRYRERMWIPLVLLRTAAVRKALSAGVSFLQQRHFVELPSHPLLSKLLAYRFWLPHFRHAGGLGDPSSDAAEVAFGTMPKFIEYDTGALVHQWLTAAGYPFIALDERQWSKVDHQHGVTRSLRSAFVRRLTNSFGLTRPNATPAPAAQQRAMQRLSEQYSVDVAPLMDLESRRNGLRSGSSLSRGLSKP